MCAAIILFVLGLPLWAQERIYRKQMDSNLVAIVETTTLPVFELKFPESERAAVANDPLRRDAPMKRIVPSAVFQTRYCIETNGQKTVLYTETNLFGILFLQPPPDKIYKVIDAMRHGNEYLYLMHAGQYIYVISATNTVQDPWKDEPRSNVRDFFAPHLEQPTNAFFKVAADDIHVEIHCANGGQEVYARTNRNTWIPIKITKGRPAPRFFD